MTVGTGETVILKVSGRFEQPFKLGVTMICAVCAVATFAVVKLILPLPEAAKPMFVFVFVQSRFAPLGFFIKLIAKG